MNDKQINKWLRSRFSALGWTLVAYNLILNGIVLAGLLLDTLARGLRAAVRGDFGAAFDMDALTGNAWGYILAAAVGLTILYGWKGWDWTKRQFRSRGRMTGAVFFSLLALLGGAQMANSLWMGLLEAFLNLFDRSALEMLEAVSGDSDTVSMFLYSVLIAPISEELLFRGFVQSSLRPYGKRFAIFGSAFLFAIFHGNLLQAPYAFFAGLILGYAAAEYGLVWAVVLHICNNLVLADLFARLLEQLPVAAGDALSLAVFGGMAVAALVLLVKNRGKIRAWREGDRMDRRCLKCFFTSSGILILTVLMTINMLSLFG